MSTSRALGDLLVECLRVPDPARTDVLRAAVADVDLTDLAAVAEYHSVLPAVYEALRTVPESPPEVLETLADRRRLSLHQHLRTVGELAAVAKTLDQAGVAWCVLKGPVLAEYVYRAPAIRSYLDLDILVQPSGFGAAIDALEASGAEVIDLNWSMVRAHQRSELSLGCPNGTPLDLHWHLFNHPRLRQQFVLDIDELLRRRRSVPIGGLVVPALDPADMLLHVATHATLAGGYRLGWVKDIEQLVAWDRPAWDVVAARALSSGLGLPTAVMLGRARRILGAEVPADVLDALAPARGWRSLIGRLDAMRPPEHSFGPPLTGRIVVSSTRRTTGESVAQLSRTAIVGRAVPFLVEAPQRLRRQLKGDGPVGQIPNPLHQAAGGMEERRRYLREVASQP
jgi:Uncharacterised nucleotidyltransferase